MRDASAHLVRRTLVAGVTALFALMVTGGSASALTPADEGGGPLCTVAHSTGVHELCMDGGHEGEH